MRILFFLLFYPAFLFCELVWEAAQPPFQAALDLSSKTVPLDGKLHLTLTLRYPDNYRIEKGALRQSLLQTAYLPFPEFQIVSEKTEESQEGNSKKMVLHYLLEPLISGTHTLGFFAIDFFEKNSSKKIALFTDLASIEVTPVQGDNSFQLILAPLLSPDVQTPIEISEENRQKIELKENSKPALMTLQEHSFPWMQVILSLLFLALLPILLAILSRKKPAPPEAVIESAKIKALKEIQSAASVGKNFSQIVFFNNLSLTMRQYIQERFGINAPTLTTEEFLNKTASGEFLDKNSRNKLQIFLEKADQIKYGHRPASSAEINESLESAKSFIQNS